MATSGAGIWLSLGNGSVRDYAHAAQIFRTNDFSRAPKSKHLFFVTININPAARSDQFTSAPVPVGPNELSYLVKSVDMPKFEMDIQGLNQYNKKVIIQKSIKYNPISIKFHDDNIGSLRHFWQSYYNYYYADGSYNNLDYDSANDDKYARRIKSRWGMDTGAKVPYLTSIEIYSMYHGTETQLITLQNPVISNFSHDTHDYSSGNELLESSMQVHYTGVTYEDMIDATYGIAGFGLDNPDTYDTELSSLSSGLGLQVNVSTGQLFNTQTSTRTSNRPAYNPNPSLRTQTNIYNQNYSTSSRVINNNQLSSVLLNTASLPTNSGYVFPTVTNRAYQNQDYGAVRRTGSVVYSDGTEVLTPEEIDTLYSANSWQKALYEKGYTSDQITAADQYIFSRGMGAFGGGLPPDDNGNYVSPNYQQIAEQFLRNSTSSTGYNFGQDAPDDFNNVLQDSTNNIQSVYQGNDWTAQLAEVGYSSNDIESADQFLSTIRLAPGADLTSIAEQYIKNSKSSPIYVSRSGTAAEDQPVSNEDQIGSGNTSAAL
jgi:hypothetical protein